MKGIFPLFRRYFHSAYVLVRVAQVPWKGGNMPLHDSATSPIGISRVFKEDEWGVQGRTPIEDDAENPWNHMGWGVLPSVHRRYREALHKLSESDQSVFKDNVAFKYANDEDIIKRLCGLK